MSQWFITRASGNIAEYNIIYHLITDLTETPSVYHTNRVGPSLCIASKEMSYDTTDNWQVFLRFKLSLSSALDFQHNQTSCASFSKW